MATKKTALVTGASTGIGEAAARLLHGRGWRVYAGVRNDQAAQNAEKNGLVPVVLDVVNTEHIASAADKILSETHGRLDGLVNNAGVAVAAPMEFVPLEELRDQLEVNVVGLTAVTQAFLPALRHAKGRIVNVGSISGILTTPLMGPYCASKYAVEAISDALRQELAPHGVKVALIQPGRIITPIWQKSMQRAEANEEKLPEEGRKLYGKLIEAVKKSVKHVEKDALPVEPVAEAIWHALTAPEPKSRYLVAKKSLFIKLVANLPDKLRDSLIRKQFGG